MNIQSEKIELIKQIADINSEQVLTKIKDILKAAKKASKSSEKPLTAVMTKKLEESKEQIKNGKGAKITLDEIWK